MKSIKCLFLVLFISTFILTIFLSVKNGDKDNLKKKEQVLEVCTDKVIVKNFKGRIFNKNNQPISNAEVNVGSLQVLSNDKGEFKLDSVIVQGDYSTIQIKKKDYLDLIKSVGSLENISNVELILKSDENSCLYWFCSHNHLLE